MPAASLLVDYTLTVAVSISAGVLALTSAFPELDAHRVAICLLFLALLTVGNLRGIRESGNIFAVPTYFFVVSIMLLLAAGLYRYVTGGIVPVEAVLPPNAGHQPVTTFLLLTAFANGCTAMTGVEAVSNGVPAFRPPEAKNASATLVAMATLAIGMFVGITLLAHAYQVVPNSAESGVSQLGRAIFGGPNFFYYLLQAGTMLILVLAANTAYADFPRLASIVSRDRYLPRQFMNQGDRLAFSNGILVLSVFAAILIMAFRGDTQALLPLYMIGVFVSFTLVAGRHGDPLAADEGAGLEDQRADQRLRRGRHRHRADHRRGHQDAGGRVDRAAADPADRDAVQGDAPPLRPRRRAADAEGATRRSGASTTPCSCRSAACSARSWRRCATPRRCPTMCARSMWTWIRRRTEQMRKDWDDLGRAGAARRPAVAVSAR